MSTLKIACTFALSVLCSAILSFVFAHSASADAITDADAPKTAGNINGDRLMFDKIYEHWTEAFNRKEYEATCSFFAKDVVADCRGIPGRNFDSISNDFKRLFRDPNRQYRYSYKLHDIYRSGDLAAIRITWTLKTIASDQTTEDVEQGLDVLKKNKAGDWQIVNFVAYEEPGALPAPTQAQKSEK